MEPKTKILYNPEIYKGAPDGKERPGADIIDYRIEEAEINPDTGDAVIETASNRPKWTGKTNEWTIKKGEALVFPAYVADALRHVYPFLTELNQKQYENVLKQKEKENAESKPDQPTE